MRGKGDASVSGRGVNVQSESIGRHKNRIRLRREVERVSYGDWLNCVAAHRVHLCVAGRWALKRDWCLALMLVLLLETGPSEVVTSK